MDLSRRSFLLGAAAALAAASLPVALALAPAEAALAPTLGELDKRFAYRWIERLLFSCAADDPLVRLDVLWRDHFLARDFVMPGTIWVWNVDATIVLPPNEVLRFDVHPHVRRGSLGLEYGIIDDRSPLGRPPELFREQFDWADDRKMTGRLVPLRHPSPNSARRISATPTMPPTA